MKEIEIAAHSALFTSIFEDALKLGIELKIDTIDLSGILAGMSSFLREGPSNSPTDFGFKEERELRKE